MCLAQIDLMFGKGTSDGVTSTHVAQYERGMPVFYPGLTWEQEPNLMPAIQERIFLANDYVQGSPTIEGAMEAGWHAGGKIAEAKG
jgi:predicted NAD/FAD-dependent oxidoreductase